MQSKPFTVANAEFCAGLSSPDGQLNDSNVAHDHPLVARLPVSNSEK